jgi:hypothetical protein
MLLKQRDLLASSGAPTRVGAAITPRGRASTGGRVQYWYLGPSDSSAAGIAKAAHRACPGGMPPLRTTHPSRLRDRGGAHRQSAGYGAASPMVDHVGALRRRFTVATAIRAPEGAPGRGSRCLHGVDVFWIPATLGRAMTTCPRSDWRQPHDVLQSMVYL